MPLSKIIQREIEVAFSKNAQPVWLRVVKYIVIGLLLYFLWGSKWLWVLFGTIFILGFALHFWYRYKTRGWTKSYGGWDYEKNKPRKD